MAKNITIDIKEIGWKDMNWILLIQGRGLWRAVVENIMKLRVA
jgi:hypothetical protein